MRTVVQRVRRAEVRLGESGEVLCRIQHGLCVLVGVGVGDTEEDAAWLVDKIAGLRVFPDVTVDRGIDAPGDGKEGPMNRSVGDVSGALLLVSQFTLYGDCRKGRRPSFTDAMPPGPAEALYDHFVALARRTGLSVAAGRFRAMMQVELVNDGPVTLVIDSRERGARAPQHKPGT